MHAYITGPMFNEGEQWWNAEIDVAVRRAGLTSFLPQRDGSGLDSPDDVPKLFEEDKDEVAKADVIVANLDGITVDSGSAWELGYAYALDKHLVGLYTDWRLHFKWQTVNLMIQCGLDKMVTSLHDLEVYLQEYRQSVEKG